MKLNTNSQDLIVSAERALFEWLRNRPVKISGLDCINENNANYSGDLLWQPVNIGSWLNSKFTTFNNDKLIWLAGIDKILKDNISQSATAVYKAINKNHSSDFNKWPKVASSLLPEHYSTILQSVLLWWIPPIFHVSTSNIDCFSVHFSCFIAFLQKPVQITQTTAELPIKIKDTSNTKIKVFSNDRGLSHIVLQFGNPQPSDKVLVRIHSQCITGDVLKSLRCDCGIQLTTALQQLNQVKSGYLLYMREEGRAIGIDNKIKAYHIQDSKNLNTYEANSYLGFAWDNRDFSEACQILKQLNVENIQLLTNNPNKISRLKNAGFNVSRKAISPKLDDIAKSYRQIKSTKGSHYL